MDCLEMEGDDAMASFGRGEQVQPITGAGGPTGEGSGEICQAWKQRAIGSMTKLHSSVQDRPSHLSA